MTTRDGVGPVERAEMDRCARIDARLDWLRCPRAWPMQAAPPIPRATAEGLERQLADVERRRRRVLALLDDVMRADLDWLGGADA